ncbi:MAG TPA: helix-turn-helix domain-containing protein [Trebonia sp.]
MSEGRKERADAARNRRAILAATEKLLADHRAQDISMDQVAAEAGVGKGTIFHRFGSRTGLMHALMYERAYALSEAITQGPPPLGPGAPDRERLLAFLDAVIETVARNKSLFAELAYAAVGQPATGAKAEEEEPGAEKYRVYPLWHGHISTLLAAQRPDLDADLTAHVMLGALHSEPVLAQLATGEAGQVAAAMRTIACSLLDAPPSPPPAQSAPPPAQSAPPPGQ